MSAAQICNSSSIALNRRGPRRKRQRSALCASVAAGPKPPGRLSLKRHSAANGCASKIKKGKRQQPHQLQMKTIFKKNNPKASSARPRAERRHTELSHRPFDQVAYAAALEVLG